PGPGVDSGKDSATRRALTECMAKVVHKHTWLRCFSFRPRGHHARVLSFWRRALSCRIFLAFSSSRLRPAGIPLPARLMKYWIMRMPEPMPWGLTFLLAIMRAMVLASLVKVPSGGKVETVFT